MARRGDEKFVVTVKTFDRPHRELVEHEDGVGDVLRFCEERVRVDVLRRLVKERDVKRLVHIEVFESHALQRQIAAVSLANHRDLIRVRRDSQRVVAHVRETGEGRSETGADVEDAGRRGRQLRHHARRRTLLRRADGLVGSLEQPVMKVPDVSLLERQHVQQDIERIVEVAIERRFRHAVKSFPC